MKTKENFFVLNYVNISDNLKKLANLADEIIVKIVNPTSKKY